MEVEEKETVSNRHPIEDELELIDYLRMLWKRRKFILLGTIFSVAAAGVISLALPPWYEATAQIRIGRVWDKDIENPYLASEFITSDAFLTKVIQKLNLQTSPYKMKKKGIVEVHLLEGGTTVGQKFPVLLGIQTHARSPQEAVDLGNAVAGFLIEEHKQRFGERLKEYQSYEKDLALQVGRIEEQINDLEGFLKKQSLNPTVNAPSVILLQSQLEQKSVQLLNFKKELKETRINNTSSIVTEDTKLIAQPILPEEHMNPKVKLIMTVAAVLGLFISLVLAFFLEYLERVRFRKIENE